MNMPTIAIINPPHRPASASLGFARETYGQWLYLAHRTSAPFRGVQTPAKQARVAQPVATARPQIGGGPAVRYFD
jgi:hypothetical protein